MKGGSSAEWATVSWLSVRAPRTPFACALAIQESMQFPSIETPPERQIQFRMGITIGDVVSDGRGIYGEAVTVASRLEGLAEPGGINVSRAVRDQVRERLSIILRDLGEHEVPNLARPVRVFGIARHKHDGSPATPVPRAHCR